MTEFTKKDFFHKIILVNRLHSITNYLTILHRKLTNFGIQEELSLRVYYRQHWPVLKKGFESVQQKHLDKTIFDYQIVNFVQITSSQPFMAMTALD